MWFEFMLYTQRNNKNKECKRYQVKSFQIIYQIPI